MRLSERLKIETQALHRDVERSGVMPAFLRGDIDRANYCAMLRNLHEIYAALEPALAAQSGEAALAALCRPTLARTPSLREDLMTLQGEHWRQLPLMPTAIEYAQRVNGAHLPSLVAHAYVRYLGDLSGGQILKRIVAQALKLKDGAGTRFYEFAEPGALALAADFRIALDSAAFDAAAQDEIVAEARLGFTLHVRLFRELASP